jgi:hypothetical protein
MTTTTDKTTVTHRPKGRVKCKLCGDSGRVFEERAALLGTLTTPTGKRIPVRGPRTRLYGEVCSCQKGGKA